ncbi:hypothetical protein LSH36_283g03036, partial [Paralvinella palmiformis]
GYYCPASTVLVPTTQPVPCSVGTFGEREGLSHQDNCTICLAGKYCNGEGMVNVSGPITGGYFSRYGTTTATPMDDDSTVRGQCPKGHYCPTGSEEPIPCPPGTYGFSWRLSSEDLCTPCGAGKYCPSQNMTADGSDCWPGYYCRSGSPVPDPANV